VTTVRGRVQNQKEKDQIEKYSQQYAGQRQVKNLLEIRPLNAVDKAVDRDR